MPSGIKMEWNTAGKGRTIGLRGERRLAERRSAVRMPSEKENQYASKTMKLLPQIDSDETIKCDTVLFLAGGRGIMWLPIWASLICLGQRNRQVIQCSCETVLSAVLPLLQVTLQLFCFFQASHWAPHFHCLFVSHSILHTLLPLLKVAQDYMNM